ILVLAALAIALLANFGRALFLVWIAATQNLAAVDRWHDLASYTIVVAVFLGTVLLARTLAKVGIKKEELRNIQPPKSEDDTAVVPPGHLLGRFRFLPSYFLILTFLYLILIELAVSSWYRGHERNLVPTTTWSVRWPQDAPGYRELPIDEHTKEMLRF